MVADRLGGRGSVTAAGRDRLSRPGDDPGTDGEVETLGRIAYQTEVACAVGVLSEARKGRLDVEGALEGRVAPGRECLWRQSSAILQGPRVSRRGWLTPITTGC